MAVQGERIPRGFILITDSTASVTVRPQTVGIIHDADECRDETLVQLHGGHAVRVPCPLEKCSAGSPDDRDGQARTCDDWSN